MLYATEATTAPVAGLIRSSVLVFPIAYSEPSALISEPWTNAWWPISSAPQGAPARPVAGVVCWAEEDVWVGEDEAEADELADEAGPPPADAGGLWCELARTAMPALAPAMTTTAAAARAGARARPNTGPPRRGRGSRPRV